MNPRCGVNWSQDGHGSNTQNQYVERGSVNFYRLQPNYFFQASGDDNRRVRIQGHGYASITVCTSRWFELPRYDINNFVDLITELTAILSPHPPIQPKRLHRRQ